MSKTKKIIINSREYLLNYIFDQKVMKYIRKKYQLDE